MFGLWVCCRFAQINKQHSCYQSVCFMGLSLFEGNNSIFVSAILLLYIWKQSVSISFLSELRHNSTICKQSLVLSFLSKLRNNSNQLFFYLMSKYLPYPKLVPKLVFLSCVPCAIYYPTPSTSVQFFVVKDYWHHVNLKLHHFLIFLSWSPLGFLARRWCMNPMRLPSCIAARGCGGGGT